MMPLGTCGARVLGVRAGKPRLDGRHLLLLLRSRRESHRVVVPERPMSIFTHDEIEYLEAASWDVSRPWARTGPRTSRRSE